MHTSTHRPRTTDFGKPLRVSRKRPCSICGKPDFCGISHDGVIAFCTRISSGSFKTARNGAYMHRLIESTTPFQRPQPQPAPIIQETPRASVEHVDGIYSMLLRSHLVLSEKDKADLMMRGLDAATVRRNGYVSTPSAIYAKHVALALSHYDLRGVPGFFVECGEPRMVWMDEGIIIPVRNQNMRIVALMYRRANFDKAEGFGKYIWISSGEDREGKPRKDGTPSGAPCHWANSHMMTDAREVTLTEGALKADVAAHLMRAPVIGNAPTCFGEHFAVNLKRDFPKLKTVFVAFDMDWIKNSHVNGALFRLTSQLDQAGFDVRVRTWSSELGKGLDDFLLNVSMGRMAA